MERGARKGPMRTMTFILDHTSAPITQAVVVGALMSGRLKMVQFLLDRAIDLPVTRTMVHAAAQHIRAECLALIWERAWRAEVTEDIFKDLGSSSGRGCGVAWEEFEVPPRCSGGYCHWSRGPNKYKKDRL